jgi:excinuclease UvrABC nuclease subunit
MGMMKNFGLDCEGFVELPGVAAPMGVYLLLAQGEVVYVGQSKNVFQRLTSHYNARRRGYRKKLYATYDNLSPNDLRGMSIPYDHMLVRFCKKAELDKLELSLIDRFKPKFNIAFKNEGLERRRFRINIKELAAKLDYPHWMRPSRESSNDLKRRRVA